MKHSPSSAAETAETVKKKRRRIMFIAIEKIESFSANLQPFKTIHNSSYKLLSAITLIGNRHQTKKQKKKNEINYWKKDSRERKKSELLLRYVSSLNKVNIIVDCGQYEVFLGLQKPKQESSV